MASVEVAIVGGGLGGLALALGLLHRGIEAHVYEKTDALLSDTATAISIGDNGARALEGLRPGLLQAMKSAGSETKSIKILDYTQGQEPIERETQKSPVLFMILWRRARQVLLEALPSRQIHPLHRLIDYKRSNEEGCVELTFSVKDDQTVGVRSRIVIGADGVRSAVRKIMVGDRPRDLHLINWNALVFNPDSQVFHVHERDQIVMIRDGASFCHLVDAGEGYTMWVLRMHNEDIPNAGFMTEDAKLRLLEEISKLEPARIWEPLKVAVEATRAGDIFQRRIIDNPPLKKWSDIDGRVLLIGDAAHAMHWGPGQGARLAFEDAHQLAEVLGEALSSKSDIQEAVSRFEEMRIPRVTKIQALAAEGTSLPEFIPEWVQQLPLPERMKRLQEFQAWVDSYPEKITGDPDSTYFKPV